MQTKLTDLTVKSLPPGKYFDATTPAFGIRIGKHRRTWIVMRGQDRQLISLGHYPSVTLQEARGEAKKLLATSAPSNGRVSFEEAYETFKAVHISQKKASTQRGYRHILETHYLPVLKNKRLSNVTTHMLMVITDALIDRPSEMHHAQAVSRMFFRWAKRRKYIDSNPLEDIQLAKAKRRKRILTDDELKAVWTAAEQTEGHFGTIVKLLILTGQRRGEIAALKSSYYSHNQHTICLPSELTKNHREHTFPVGSLASALLLSASKAFSGTTDTASEKNNSSRLFFPARGHDTKPFSGWSKSKQVLDKLASIPHWTLHDLRRTYRTNLGRLGITKDIAERMINHISSQSEVEIIYDRHPYLEEMRAAQQTYESWLAQLLNLQ